LQHFWNYLIDIDNLEFINERVKNVIRFALQNREQSIDRLRGTTYISDR